MAVRVIPVGDTAPESYQCEVAYIVISSVAA